MVQETTNTSMTDRHVDNIPVLAEDNEFLDDKTILHLRHS